MLEYCMPKMDHTSEEATIAEWVKKEGDMVKRGELLLRVETGKTILDVEAPFNGRIAQIVVPEGETVPVQALIAYIEEM